MDLSGHWKGKYTYGKNYPSQFIGKSEPFEFNITDNKGVISGTCIDNLVKAKEGNESYIVGNFAINQITFKKRYKFHFSMDESGGLFLDDQVKFDGVDYQGRLRKRFFSGKHYFSGKWSITAEFKDENNMTQTFICQGTWEMTRV